MARLFGRHIPLPALLISALVGLIFLHFVGVLQPVESVLLRAIGPIQRVVYQSGARVHEFYRSSGDETDPEAENQQLHRQIEQLQAKNAELQTRINELSQFGELKGFFVEHPYGQVTARVIGRSFEPNAHELVIDQGSAAGITVGAPVVSGTGFLIATVREVTSHSSRILLLTDSRSVISGEIQNQTQSQGKLEGDRGLTLRMSLIPQEDVVAVGDPVVTAGFELPIPRGLIVGHVNQVLGDENDFFKTVVVEQSIDMEAVTIVSVLTAAQN